MWMEAGWVICVWLFVDVWRRVPSRVFTLFFTCFLKMTPNTHYFLLFENDHTTNLFLHCFLHAFLKWPQHTLVFTLCFTCFWKWPQHKLVFTLFVTCVLTMTTNNLFLHCFVQVVFKTTTNNTCFYIEFCTFFWKWSQTQVQTNNSVLKGHYLKNN